MDKCRSKNMSPQIRCGTHTECAVNILFVVEGDEDKLSVAIPFERILLALDRSRPSNPGTYYGGNGAEKCELRYSIIEETKRGNKRQLRQSSFLDRFIFLSVRGQKKYFQDHIFVFHNFFKCNFVFLQNEISIRITESGGKNTMSVVSSGLLDRKPIETNEERRMHKVPSRTWHPLSTGSKCHTG